MTPHFQNRLTEVSRYFQNGDDHLGYRRLLDAAIETGNDSVYEATLSFCDWYDSSGEHGREELHRRASDLLARIGQGYREQPPVRSEPRLAADGIAKRYSRGNFSLSPLDISLYPGRIAGLVGENGNGKTTLLRMLYGELQPDTGTVTYHFNRPLADQTPYSTRSRLAFIPQRPSPWYGLLMDNLQFAATYTGLKGKSNWLWTEMIIARMGLRPYRDYTWGRISSGYKMRFELARTLIRRPEVLLLDEPLANLDILAQQVILEDLRFLARSESMPLSIILSSQQLYEVEKVSDEVIFLQNGVARYQALGATQREESSLVLEIESPASREELERLLGPKGLQRLSFNGGVYILYFNEGATSGEVLVELGSSGLPVQYFRDISLSSRRFFDA